MKKAALIILFVSVIGLVWTATASTCDFVCRERIQVPGTNVEVLWVSASCGSNAYPDTAGWSGKWGGSPTNTCTLKVTDYLGAGKPASNNPVWNHIRKLAKNPPAKCGGKAWTQEGSWEFFQK